MLLERLETRWVLNGVPVGRDDRGYWTAEETPLIVGSGLGLLANDGDPEGSALAASIVDPPAHGTLSGFNAATGTFTYTPDTSFVGVDTFTYAVSDGTDASPPVTVAIAVGTAFGARTNGEEQARGGEAEIGRGGDANSAGRAAGFDLLTGCVVLRQPLTPGWELIYNSNTLPRPIVVLETFLPSGGDVPCNLGLEESSI